MRIVLSEAHVAKIGKLGCGAEFQARDKGAGDMEEIRSSRRGSTGSAIAVNDSLLRRREMEMNIQKQSCPEPYVAYPRVSKIM